MLFVPTGTLDKGLLDLSVSHLFCPSFRHISTACEVQ